VPPEQVDEDALRAHLYAPQMPDPDLVIRTSGELRVSNFLLWQAAYAEYHFTSTLWPDFDGGQLQEALDAYVTRRRRFGRR
jgi:undecaprenyl diphosphate synthase